MDNHQRQPPSSQSVRRMMKFNTRNQDGSRLIEFVKCQLLLKMTEEERKKPKHELPEDCFSHILHLLPIKALLLSRCVCKLLNDITKEESFIQSHLNRSEPVLLFTESAPLLSDQSTADPRPPALPQKMKKPETFIVEVHAQEDQALNLFKCQSLEASPPQKYLHFLDITEDGRTLTATSFNVGFSGRLLGSCNGLILFESKPKKAGLIIMNPVTRKLKTFQAGTLVSGHRESYGFSYDGSRKEYKVVHLFLDGGQHASCEILTVEKRRWKMVDGPPLSMFPSPGLFTSVDILRPIATTNALHWVPHHSLNANAKLGISMDLEQEKFFQMVLPEIRGEYDGFVKMENRLCFVNHEEEANQITIWMLMSLHENLWSKCHCFSLTLLPSKYVTPLISSRSGSSMIFRQEKFHDEDGNDNEVMEEAEDESGSEEEASNGSEEINSPYYIYDFIHGECTNIKMKKGGLATSLPRSFIPHVNSFITC